MYAEFILQLCMYAKARRVLAKGYLPISLISALKLHEILNAVQTAVQETNPDYDIVIKRLHLYYDMKLVTFGIDSDQNLKIQFPVFIQPYIQQPLILYQIEAVPVLIIDRKEQVDSYTHLQIDRPYMALNSETYISIRQQELQTCKNIGYDFYCEELFVLKHKTKYSCESVIYFNLGSDIIKENCKFAYYFNKADITPPVLDGGNKIIFTRWPNINILSVISTVIFQLKLLVILMFW